MHKVTGYEIGYETDYFRTDILFTEKGWELWRR